LKKELEFRGIPFRQIEMYLQELGCKRMTESLPIIYKGESWGASIISEEEISFTAVFKVNAIKILFNAENQEILEVMIKKFRKKTFRAGG
jgi:hypothetical protein